jgi:hypothetical protein
VLTIVVRIRANRLPVSDADHFRGQVRAGLISAQEEAHRRGYNRQDAYMAAQAVVAFLDESILNSQNPALRDWVEWQRRCQVKLTSGMIDQLNGLWSTLAAQGSPELKAALERSSLRDCPARGFAGVRGLITSHNLRSPASAAAKTSRWSARFWTKEKVTPHNHAVQLKSFETTRCGSCWFLLSRCPRPSNLRSS